MSKSQGRTGLLGIGVALGAAGIGTAIGVATDRLAARPRPRRRPRHP